MEQEEAGKKDKPPLPKVDLGSNSLLLIALIVGVCSGAQHRSDQGTQQEVAELRQSVERLEKKVDDLHVLLTTGAQPAAGAAAGQRP
jgi:hypothetical protein